MWQSSITYDFYSYHRSIKKNNFFTPVGTRMGDDHSELCVENSQKGKATINLQLKQGSKPRTDRPKTNGLASFTNNSQQQLLRQHFKSPRETLYRSATNVGSSSKPLFQSVNSYLNFHLKPRAPGLYSSEQYLDSNRLEKPLKSLENHLKRPISKRLVAKYSDMEIQKELNDFFKIRSVKWFVFRWWNVITLTAVAIDGDIPDDGDYIVQFLVNLQIWHSFKLLE